MACKTDTHNEYVPNGDDVGALVLDFGSATVRFGHAGDDCPKQVWPSVVGQPMLNAVQSTSMTDNDTVLPQRMRQYCGDCSTDSLRSVVFPVNRNIAVPNSEIVPVLTPVDNKTGVYDFNTDAAETIIRRISSAHMGLNCSINGRAVMLTEPSTHSPAYREKLAQLMFESLDAEAIYLAKSAVLSAFAVGRSCGCVVDMGAAGTTITPIQDGYTLQKNIVHYPVSGDLMDDFLLHVLKDYGRNAVAAPFQFKRAVSDARVGVQGVEEIPIPEGVHDSYTDYCRRMYLRSLKENVTRCVDDAPDITSVCNVLFGRAQLPLLHPAQHPNSTAAKYQLPDGNAITNPDSLGAIVGEFFLQPVQTLNASRISNFQITKSLEKAVGGLSSCVLECIRNCDVDLRKELSGFLILTGGVSTIQGLPDRLPRECTQLGGQLFQLKIKVVSPSCLLERRYSSWVGGSILSSLATFQQMWLSKAEYDEHGATLVERKCRL
eukprot:Lankesteria_metandrocarpae@DN2924_c0_g1_i1.p1